MNTATCLYCGTPLKPSKQEKRFCDGRCRNRYWSREHFRITVNPDGSVNVPPGYTIKLVKEQP